jgi:hypothetical protein
MGLDMYLEAKKYFSQNNWSNGESTPNSDYTALMALAPSGLVGDVQFGGASVGLTVAYWRKANAIHGWFVNTLAGGVDECQEIYVPRNALVDLLAACKVVMSVSVGESKQDLADEVGLMPTEGFFFGGYELDEYYDQDLKYTIEMIENILTIIPEDNHDWSLSYRASW